MDLRLRPRSYWDRQILYIAYQKQNETKPFLDFAVQEGRFEVENSVYSQDLVKFLNCRTISFLIYPDIICGTNYTNNIPQL